MTQTKFTNQSISTDGFEHSFTSSGKIKCNLKKGSVTVKTKNKSVTLAFSPIGSAVGVEDEKPSDDTSKWTITVKRSNSSNEASVNLEVPLV